MENELFPMFCSKEAYGALHSSVKGNFRESRPLPTNVESGTQGLNNSFPLCVAGWVVGSLEILGSPASLVRSIGNGISDFFRLPYEGLMRGPGAFVSGVSRGTTSFVKHISKGSRGVLTSLCLVFQVFKLLNSLASSF